MKVNLNDLANELARADEKSGIDLTSAHVKIVLGLLGDKLRACKEKNRCAILDAILERAGKDDNE